MKKPYLKKMLESVFLKKITVFKWQMNLFALICTLSGILIGTFFGVRNIIKLLAANDTVQTWILNSSTISGYTYDNTLIQASGSNVTGGINKVLNGTFNSDTNSWTGIQSYILDDEFSDTQPSTLVSEVSTLSNGGVITPIVGSDMFVAGAGIFTSGIYNWIPYGANTIQNDSNTLKITHVDSSAGAYEYLDNSTVLASNPVDHTWYQLQFDAKVNSGGSVGFHISNSIYGSDSVVTGTEFSTFTNTNRKLAGQRLYATSRGMDAGEIAWWDNITLKALTGSSLFSAVNTSSSNVVVSAGVTLTRGTQAGVVANLDSTSNPQNFIIAYHDGTNAHLDKAVNGVYTSLINTSATYVAGATIKINKDNNGYSLIYNGTQVGSTQNISDAGIINNTIHGLFSTYASNSFTNFLVKSSLNGTIATPLVDGNGAGARVIADKYGYTSTENGKLKMTQGASTGGDPGIWYPYLARVAGRTLISLRSEQIGNNGTWLGWDTDQVGGISIVERNDGYLRDISSGGSGGGAFLANMSSNTNYNYALTLRDSGNYQFIKGGAFNNWTLLWFNSFGNQATLSPAFYNNNSSNVLMDYLRVPTQTYLPTPIAYDTFTRSNSTNIGNTETTGPDSQTTPSLVWNNGGTWSISGNSLINNPTVGNNIITNGTFDSDTGWTKGDQWTIGSGVASHAVSALDSYITNTGTAVTANTWYSFKYDLTNQGSGGSLFYSYVGGTNFGVTNSSGTIISTGHNTTSTTKPEVRAVGGAIGNIDNIIVKPFTLSSLFSTVSSSTSSIVESTNVTLASGTQAGLVTNLDSYDNPQNFLVAYHDGTKIHLDKAVSDNATLTNLITNGSFETLGDTLFSSWSKAIVNGQGNLEDEQSIFHTGSHALKITGDRTVGYRPAFQQNITVAANTTYNLSFWTRGDGVNSPRFEIWNSSAGSSAIGLTNIGNSGTSYKLYTLTFTTPTGCTNIGISLLAANVDGAIAYFDDVSLTVVPNITYTSLINTSTNAAYVAGAPLTVITDNSTSGHLKVRVYYNNALVGSEQDIADAGIINNTNHGLFSTYSGNTLDNFTLFARGTNGEYNGIPAEDLTATYDTSTKYSGTGSSKLVAAGNDANYTQTINLGNTNTYQLVTYAYTNGSEVTTNDLNLLYNGNVVTTTFTPTATSGWYKLTGTITGVASNALIGVRVKAGKTVYIDEFLTYKTGLPYIYTTTAYANPQMVTLDSFNADITNPGSSSVTFQLCPDDGSTCESGASWQYYNGTGWAVATNMSTNTNTKAQLTESVMKAFPTTSKKVSVKAILNLDVDNIPTVTNIAVGMTTDVTPPTSGTNPVFDIRTGTQCTYTDNCWTDQTSPKFSWNAGTDDNTGIRGYCLYLGTDESAHAESSKGKLGTSPEPLGNTTCQFIVPNANIDLSTAGYLSSALSNNDEFLTEPNTYYLKIKAVDRADNVATNGLTIRFRYDKVGPTNVSYISTPSGNFSDVADMAFSWPITGGGIANDAQSSIFGYQYQINATSTDGWKGTTHSDALNLDYIPADQTTYKLTQVRDGNKIVSGNNVIYFRAIDIVGNPSLYVSGGISFGGQAPKFGTEDQVTVTPTTSTTNNYALSWPSATASTGSNVAHYYYMVNTPPPSTRETLEGNPSTYMDNGTSRTVNTKSLPNVNKVSNTIYVVAVDDEETPNYSPSNYITGTFTLNSSSPDNVGNLIASDSSIKAQEKWNVTLTYTAPEYQGAGNLTYQIMRSSNGTSYSLVGTSSGLSYVDSAPSSSKYYYKVYTKDGANALSTGSNAVEITPTGRWTSPADILTQPEVKNIATKKATILWTTERTSDSKVAFGTKSMEYFTEEPSNSNQVTGHNITLSGLNASTTYYYVAKWTDEDGNTGISEEQSFQTAPAPTVKNVTVSGVGLSNAMIQFTSIGSSKIKIYYGPSTAFGGTQEVYTSTSESKYTIQLSDLVDGTKYYYKINTFDSDLNEYEGTVLDFTTMPRPKITNVTLQEATGTAQTTILVSWTSNTDISSIITYYPEGKESQLLDQVDVKMLAGKHQMTVKGLVPQTNYILVVKGVDRIGNMAQSESQRFTTATDTRPPAISNLSIQGQIIPGSGSSEDSTAQLVVSWNTDEPATSQVEFGVGSGSIYSQKTQLDSNLTYNHIVVISGLVPSMVYHLRGLSLDVIGNSGNSVDTVTIAPKATANALNLVISNLADIFGFLRK